LGYHAIPLTDTIVECILGLELGGLRVKTNQDVHYSRA